MNTLSRPKPNVPSGLPRALQFDPDASAYATDLSGRAGATPLGVVRCRVIDDLEELVQWANRVAVPLVPVSSPGGPRRRGDTICPQPAIIVDLSGLNRVVHVDGRDAVAVVEPGVTFAALEVALKPHRLKPFLPLLPRSSKSVLAAFLEREPIMSPGRHWDSADPLASLELVFGTGDRFRTGGAALPGTMEENLARGNRPMLTTGPGQTDFARMVQGAQGSLAIVARGSIVCDRIPTVSVPLFVSADSLGPVVQTAYAMLRKRHDGKLLLVNAAQLALMLGDNPASVGKLKPLLPAWTMFIELTATEHFPEEAIAYRRADLDAAAGAASAQVHEELGGHRAASLAAVLDQSTDTPYKSRTGGAYEEVFFLSQLNRVQRQIDAIADSGRDAADVAIYLQPLAQGVNAHCEFTFFAPELAAARTMARRAAERFADAGAFFSRPYHLWADLAFARDPQIVGLLGQTKDIFDPNQILQPQSQALGATKAPFAASVSRILS